jgi:pimeloyl-ACP methyl ester carboxylesterase
LRNGPISCEGTRGSFSFNISSNPRFGAWDSSRFSRMIPASRIATRSADESRSITGLGVPMVGVIETKTGEGFYPSEGVAAPVTAYLGFFKNRVTLAFYDPARVSRSPAAIPRGALAADPIAALDWYRRESVLWNGMMGAIHGSRYMSHSGLYMLQPYDARRIPLVFVHGLVSTSHTWRKVINGIEADPALRGKYQYMVFRYPTGNPISYSALLLRNELKRFRNMHPDAPDFVLVGHSMGGILSKMQAITVSQKSWNVIGKENADAFFSIVEPGSVGARATCFEANPNVARLVFICTPHRGSTMAIGSIGKLFRRLIALPADVSGPLLGSATHAIAVVSGTPGRLPSSITGLSPQSSTLRVMDSIPLSVPHHSIIGDRGKGDSPDSSDGVVEYKSSHMPHADSECIVPGNHGSQTRPEAIDELRRILRLHLHSD